MLALTSAAARFSWSLETNLRLCLWCLPRQKKCYSHCGQTHMTDGLGNRAERGSSKSRLVCVWGLVWRVDALESEVKRNSQDSTLIKSNFSVFSPPLENTVKCLTVSTSPFTSSAIMIKAEQSEGWANSLGAERALPYCSGPHAERYLKHLTVAYSIPEGFLIPHNLQMYPCHQLLKFLPSSFIQCRLKCVSLQFIYWTPNYW